MRVAEGLSLSFEHGLQSSFDAIPRTAMERLRKASVIYEVSTLLEFAEDVAEDGGELQRMAPQGALSQPGELGRAEKGPLDNLIAQAEQMVISTFSRLAEPNNIYLRFEEDETLPLEDAQDTQDTDSDSSTIRRVQSTASTRSNTSKLSFLNTQGILSKETLPENGSRTSLDSMRSQYSVQSGYSFGPSRYSLDNVSLFSSIGERLQLPRLQRHLTKSTESLRSVKSIWRKPSLLFGLRRPN